MVSRADSNLRVIFPAEWRQMSFICFDLGVMNFIGGAGAAFLYSMPLQHMGFGLGSLWLGLFFILLGLNSYKVRLPFFVGLFIIVADALNTALFLPKYEVAAGIFLVKLSFLLPLFLTLTSILRVRLKLKSPRPESSQFTAIKRGKEAFALLSSIFLSVGTGMAALLLFATYALPPITQATNPLINIFHDLFLVPALLLLFPVGAALGELMWGWASRFYLSGPQLTLFLRHVIQMPLLWRLTNRLTRDVSTSSDQAGFTMNGGVVTQSPPTVRHRWLKYFLVASAVLLIIFHVSFLFFVYKRFAPDLVASKRGSGAVVISNSGNRQYKTINAAIAAAPTGATIVVRPGVYREIVLIDKEITLVGDEGPHAPTIECSQGGCVQIIAKATIRNFTIRARMGWLQRLIKYEQRPAAVVIVGSQAVIENSDVSSNRGPGIVVSGSGYDSVPEFRNVRVHDCMLNGILFTNKSHGIVVDSDVYGNEWAGIRSERDSNPIIRHSRIHGGKQAGILLDNGSAVVEECEIFENNYAGVHARNRSSVSVSRSKSFKNNGNGMYVGDGSFGKAEGCEISANKQSGIEIDDDSDAQLLDIQVHHQQHGIVVWHQSTAVVENAKIYENATGLFVESGGKPIVRKSVFRSHVYSAIEIRAGGEPTIETSQVYDGQTSGIYFRNGASGRVKDCAIFGNAMSNIIIAAGSDPEVSKTKLSESGYAGVLVMEGGQGSVTDCEIFNNYLGIEIRSNSTLSVQNSTIKDNRHQGLVADSTSSGSITGSTLLGNADGAWKIEPGSRLVRQGNTE